MEILTDIPLVTCGDLFSANLLLISQLTAEKSCCNGWVFWVSPNRELPEMSQLFRLVNHNPRFVIYSNYWWLVGDLEHFFPYIGNNHTNWLIFSEGLKPPTRQFVIYSIDEYCYRSWCEIDMIEKSTDPTYHRMIVIILFIPFHCYRPVVQ